MGTQYTELNLINFSGKDIVETRVTIDQADNWGGDYRPDKNFTGALSKGSGRSVHQEISTSTENGCWFSIEVIFADGSYLKFRANQWDAMPTHKAGNYSVGLEHSPENNYLSIFQTTGEDRYRYSNSYYIRPTQTMDNSHWMRDLMTAKPNIQLNQLTMPGSHDAGMYTNITEQARTQTGDFYYQLQCGTRYFDLRIYAHFHGDLYTWHGASDGGKLSDILIDVKRFLNSAPEEVVILKFRSYAARDRASTIQLVKHTLGTKLFCHDHTPNIASEPLKTFKGKVVAVFTADYAEYYDSKTGIFPYSDYGNENTGEAISHPNNASCLGVYDSYSHQSEFAVMKPDQLKKLAKHGGYNKDYLFLFSWTLTGSTDNVLDLILLSSYANPQLAEVLNAIQYTSNAVRPNIVYLDYVDSYLCKRIIDMNY